MSTQIFLYLDIQGTAIKGEATAGGYEDEIEVERFGWGMSSETGCKASASKALSNISYKRLTITKLYDTASTNLARYLTRGARFDQAVLSIDHHVLPTGSKKKPNPSMVIELRDGFIEEVRLSMSESGKSAAINEDISLSFSKINILYFPTGVDRDVRQAPVSFEARVPVDKL